LRNDDAVEPILDVEFLYQALAQRGESESENISLEPDFMCG